MVVVGLLVDVMLVLAGLPERIDQVPVPVLEAEVVTDPF
jgi:hypothetical protein